MLSGYGCGCPCWTDVTMIPLNVITLLPQVSDCETGQGVPLNVTAVAQVRIVKDEESYTDREKFALNVREQAQMDVSKMGIRILSFVIKDVTDREDYLEAIGRAETAKVVSRAAIEKANAERDAFLKEQSCEKDKQNVRFEVDTNIADFQKAFEAKKAEFETVVNTAKAESDMAYQLQSSKLQQVIVDEKLKVDVVEMNGQIKIEEKEIIRAEKSLTAT